MEDRVERHVITPLKGICYSPSDLTCDDEQLAVCEGLLNDGGELKAVQRPKITFDEKQLTGKLIYIHNTNNTIRYISYDEENVELYFSCNDKLNIKFDYNPPSKVIKIVSCGETIICITEKGQLIYKYSAYSYIYYGDSIPKPNFTFKLGSPEAVEESGSAEGMNQLDAGTIYDITAVHIFNDKTDDFESLVTGLYAKVKAGCYEKKKFFSPFFVRGALEMFDGSYMYISNPVLMIPSIKAGVYTRALTTTSELPIQIAQLACSVVGRELYYEQETDYTDYSDLVKNIAIFITNPVDMYSYKETKEYWNGALCPVFQSYYTQFINNPDKRSLYQGNQYWYEDDSKKFLTALNGDIPYGGAINISAYCPALQKTGGSHDYNFVTCAFDFLTRKTDNELIQDLEECHIYYKLCDVNINPAEESTANYIRTGVLTSLVDQTRLEKEDYYGWTNVALTGAEVYNSRLHGFGIKRSFFDGFTHHMSAYAKTNYTKLDIYVEIDVNGNKRVVKAECDWSSSTYAEMLGNGYWFYYPDTRAKHYWVVDPNENKIIFDDDLKVSSQLNGAYAITKYPSEEIDTFEPTRGDNFEKELNGELEYLNNQLLQYEVNNPFALSAWSYYRVGGGDIIGLSALTTGLSNDAYSVSSVLCFTKQGIWALLSNDDGTFKTLSPPFSREVCSNSDSITMTDNMVFFVSKKGLMCIVGTSENAVVCVSQQLDGATTDSEGNRISKADFLEFIEDCKIAYDYKASCLYLYKEGDATVWIYNIKSQTFSIDYDFFNDSKETIISTAVADYPDYVIQGTDSKLYTLIGKDEREDDAQSYTGNIESRPMKLDGSAYLKSLRRVKKLEMLSGSSTLTLYGSNDLKTWTELKSLQGKPYRFFKYKMSFTNMKATDTFSGLVMDTQVRYTDKPH